MRRIRIKDRRRGNSILEFSLCLLVLAPALLGMFTVGMNLNRNLQATQVARDAGHMFVRSVDFSEASNQRLLARLARELRMVQGGTTDTPDPTGPVVVILTKFHVPTVAECAAASLALATCINIDKPVIAQRLVIGNPGLFNSPFGTPEGSFLHSGGGIDNADMLTVGALVAQNQTLLPLIPPGQDAYLAEVYVASPDFDLAGSITGTGVYARAIY
jgi:hypothetical protein